MNDAFIAFMVYLFLCTMFGPVVAMLIELVRALLVYVGLALRIAAGAIARGAWVLLRLIVRALMRGTWLAALFLYLLAAELVRGDRQQHAGAGASGADDDHQHGDDDDEDDLREAAMILLGLSHGFTRAELEAAFRAAIKKAHPDAGGSISQAQAVNAARDLLIPHAA